MWSLDPIWRAVMPEKRCVPPAASQCQDQDTLARCGISHGDTVFVVRSAQTVGSTLQKRQSMDDHSMTDL